MDFHGATVSRVRWFSASVISVNAVSHPSCRYGIFGLGCRGVWYWRVLAQASLFGSP